MSEFVKNLKCSNCGKGFQRRHDRVLKGENFCALPCRVSWRQKNITAKRIRKCEICGTQFTPRQVQISKGQGRFCSKQCSTAWLSTVPRSKEWKENISNGQKGREAPSGPDHPCWKGGKYTETNGYVRVNIAPNKYRSEHRREMEKHIGRRLSPNEIVHHKNHDKTDNRIENLEIMSPSEHAKHHSQFRRKRGNGQFK